MRKLIFILCLVLASCSKEEDPEPVEYHVYTINLSETCPELSTLNRVEVTKDTYEDIKNNLIYWGCQTYLDPLYDINGNPHSGYVAGASDKTNWK